MANKESLLLWEALEEAFPKKNKLTVNLREEVERAEKELIAIAYRENIYNQTKTAKALNISRPLLIHKLKKYKLLDIEDSV